MYTKLSTMVAFAKDDHRIEETTCYALTLSFYWNVCIFYVLVTCFTNICTFDFFNQK